MAEEKIRGFCKDCNKFVVVFRPTPNHVLHLLLSIFTLGFWLGIWILLSIRFGGWKCSECGSKRINQTAGVLAKVSFAILIFFILSVIISGTKQYFDKKNATNQVAETLAQPEPEKQVIAEPPKKVEPQITQEQKPDPVPVDTTQNKTWVGDWGNGIIATVSSQPCGNNELINQNYSYLMFVSIPKSRLKNPDDAWQIQGDRAITITGCWIKNPDSMIHAKLNKKNGKTWEQNFKMNDGNWTVKGDSQPVIEVAQPVSKTTQSGGSIDEANAKINAVWKATTKEIRAMLLTEQRAWLKQRENDCSLVADKENCMVTMTNLRTEILKQKIAVLSK